MGPLLCNDREMGGYTRAVSRQRLGKHVPVARQQILNNATFGVQKWKSRVFYVVRFGMLYSRDKVSLVSSVWEFVREDLSRRQRNIHC
jgi:hypothetical protein